MLTAAGAYALVAGQSTTFTQLIGHERTDAMEQIPDMVRMKALKGFRAVVKGQYTIVNPGDVVTLHKATAIDLRQANKAVMTDEPEKMQQNYLPERKRPKPAAKESAAKAA